MSKITRRQKQEALQLIESRELSSDLAFKLIGHIESETRMEAHWEGSSPKTIGRVLTEFVMANSSDIRDCNLRKS